MATLVSILYAAIAVAAGAAGLFLWRLIRRTGGHAGGRRWVERQHDRRRRSVPVPIERRRRTRRSHDQAQEFLRGLES
jgi:hypothetical protein